MSKRVVPALLLACLLSNGVLAPGVFAQTPATAQLTPAQTAFLKAETKRIEDRFVGEVARITGTSPAQVRRAMPDEKRITVAVSRLVSALEMDMGSPLSPEQQAAILEADQARKQALAQAGTSAAQH